MGLRLQTKQKVEKESDTEVSQSKQTSCLASSYKYQRGT